MEQTAWQNTPEFWDARYRESNTPWNQKGVSPRLDAFMQNEGKSLFPAGARLAVLGCGHGHEAAYFSQLGFKVTAFDFSRLALDEAKSLYPEMPVDWVEANILAVPENYTGQFEGVIEYTCFCAINPQERKAYIESVSQLLAPGGLFLGALWLRADNLPETDHPPFRLTRLQVAEWFMDNFRDVRSYDFPEMVEWAKYPTDVSVQRGERAELVVVLKEPINSCYTGIKP